MCKHRVVVLQDVLAVIAGSGQGKIRFEHALQCAEIEYELNYLHHSKHDANYLYEMLQSIFQVNQRRVLRYKYIFWENAFCKMSLCEKVSTGSYTLKAQKFNFYGLYAMQSMCMSGRMETI